MPPPSECPTTRRALVAERDQQVAHAAGVRAERVVAARLGRVAVAEQVGRDHGEVARQVGHHPLPGRRARGDAVDQHEQPGRCRPGGRRRGGRAGSGAAAAAARAAARPTPSRTSRSLRLWLWLLDSSACERPGRGASARLDPVPHASAKDTNEQCTQPACSAAGRHVRTLERGGRSVPLAAGCPERRRRRCARTREAIIKKGEERRADGIGRRLAGTVAVWIARAL